MLKGTYFARNGLKGTIYALNTLGGGRFTKVTSGNIPENSAYLQFGDDAPTGMLSLEFSDEPTAVQEVNSQSPSVNGQMYDLQGRKLNGQSPKGIFIQDGKVIKNQ